MRSVLPLSLSLGLFIGGVSISPGVAAAASAHRVPLRHHERVDIRPRPSDAVPAGWYKFPGYPAIPPEENRNLDPSNFGGG
ncbi:MAG: hypothetical protein WA702_25640 [Bradyrhizobium sp.]|uniref:hypothetical protein n=1 Tax=Bradyrhizobium sp. TaxID=376 RepID=UPI003C7D0823